jgi:hypothetical protein
VGDNVEGDIFIADGYCSEKKEQDRINAAFFDDS